MLAEEALMNVLDIIQQSDISIRVERLDLVEIECRKSRCFQRNAACVLISTC